MNTLLRHAPPGRQHRTNERALCALLAPFLLLPAGPLGNQAAFQNNTAHFARYLRDYSRRSIQF